MSQTVTTLTHTYLSWVELQSSPLLHERDKGYSATQAGECVYVVYTLQQFCVLICKPLEHMQLAGQFCLKCTRFIIVINDHKCDHSFVHVHNLAIQMHMAISIQLI